MDMGQERRITRKRVLPGTVPLLRSLGKLFGYLWSNSSFLYSLRVGYVGRVRE